MVDQRGSDLGHSLLEREGVRSTLLQVNTWISITTCNIHKSIHFITIIIRYACDECGKEFHSQQVLDRHLKTHEVGEDGEETHPFACDLCDYKTSAHNGVALHKRSAHKVDKNNQQLDIDDNPFHQDRDSKRFAFVCDKVRVNIIKKFKIIKT